MALQPIERRSLSDSVYDQLSKEIVSGHFAPGEPLPPERTLCALLQVNRGAIREAVKRLSQAGLVASHHGSGHRVLDFRRNAGLDLLSQLLIDEEGNLDLQVVRSVMEMRSAIGPDAARLCAQRGSQACHQEIVALVEQMRQADGDIATLQDLNLQLWEQIIEGSGNIAYALAYNSLRDLYEGVRELMGEVLADELRDLDGLAATAAAIGDGDGAAARDHARSVIDSGLIAVVGVIEFLESTDQPLHIGNMPAGRESGPGGER